MVPQNITFEKDGPEPWVGGLVKGLVGGIQAGQVSRCRPHSEHFVTASRREQLPGGQGGGVPRKPVRDEEDECLGRRDG